MYRNACIQTRDIHKPKVKSEQKVCVTERVTSARGPCERVREKREALPPLPFSLSALGMLVPKGPQSRPPDIVGGGEGGLRESSSIVARRDEEERSWLQ